MTLLEELADLLQSEGAGVKGQSIFVDNIPSGVTLAVGLFGKLSGNSINYELPGYRNTGFQLVVRCGLFGEGSDLIKRATDAISIFEERTIGDYIIKYVRPKHDPVTYPVSDGNLTEFSVNFDAVYVMV